MKKFIAVVSLLFFCCPCILAEKTGKERPDLESIRKAVTDEKSKFYYPKLLKMFLSNDTVMTDQQYQYFYYGTMFQEDYDPYRPPFDEARLQEVQPLYSQRTPLTNAQKELMLAYAEDALRDNPLDLTQLKYRIAMYDMKKKENLGKIWRSKLNHLLFVIASSGSGLSEEEAWLVVYPSHEVEFLTFQDMSITAMTYIEPHYEYVIVKQRSEKDPEGYYFDLGPMLEQYYLKHPSEIE